ncbi:MAG: universal stress protein [Solirubrobacteraceae bacterium]
MFKKVMWATDGSAAADKAMPYAKGLAAADSGDLLVAHCEELMQPGKGGGAFPVNADEHQAKQKIERQVAELSSDGVHATLQMMRARSGGAAHSIAEAVEEAEVDVIVVGTRGHTPLSGLLLGSVTQRLLHIAPCPVLAVPAQRHATGG